MFCAFNYQKIKITDLENDYLKEIKFLANRAQISIKNQPEPGL